LSQKAVTHVCDRGKLPKGRLLAFICTKVLESFLVDNRSCHRFVTG